MFTYNLVNLEHTRLQVKFAAYIRRHGNASSSSDIGKC